jgi:hypothetical protein
MMMVEMECESGRKQEKRSGLDWKRAEMETIRREISDVNWE